MINCQLSVVSCSWQLCYNGSYSCIWFQLCLL